MCVVDCTSNSGRGASAQAVGAAASVSTNDRGPSAPTAKWELRNMRVSILVHTSRMHAF